MTMRLKSEDYIRADKNPWGLTPQECAALRLICEHGSIKMAWAKGGMEYDTIVRALARARSRMGLRPKDVRPLILWDRWTRETEAKSKPGASVG